MDQVVARTLRPYERQKLHRLKRQLSNAVNSRHARVILLSTGGVSNREIAHRCDCSPAWVRILIHRFNSGGIDAITWYPYYCTRAGPRKFLAEITEQIAEVALSSPKALIGMSVWSLPKLRDYLVAQKIVARHLPRAPAADPQGPQDPLAAHQDLERVHRPAVLGQIPANPPAVQGRPAGRRAAAEHRRVWPLEPAAPPAAATVGASIPRFPARPRPYPIW